MQPADPVSEGATLLLEACNVPHGDEGAPLAGRVWACAMKDTRVADDHISSANGHIHATLLLLVLGRGQPFLGLAGRSDGLRMCWPEGAVEGMRRAVRGWQDAEAAIGRGRVRQVEHGEELRWCSSVGGGLIIPEPAVLMPTERGRVRRLGDDEARHPSNIGARKAEAFERLHRQMMPDQLGKGGVLADGDQRAREFVALEVRKRWIIQQPLAHLGELVTQRVVEDIRNHREAIRLEPSRARLVDVCHCCEEHQTHHHRRSSDFADERKFVLESAGSSAVLDGQAFEPRKAPTRGLA